MFCLLFLELLAKHYTQVNAHVHRQFVQQLNAYCNKTILDEGPDEAHRYQWTYYNAFFFALTTLSTIGEHDNANNTNNIIDFKLDLKRLCARPINGSATTTSSAVQFQLGKINLDLLVSTRRYVGTLFVFFSSRDPFEHNGLH